MKADRILMAAHAAGVHIEVDKGDFILEADSPPPDDIVEAVFSAKAAIIALLGGHNGPPSDENCVSLFPDRNRSFPETFNVDPHEYALTTWMNNHPVVSPPDRCAWCFRPEQPDHAVVPFGVHTPGNVWLHGECWYSWQQHRRQMAIAALKADSELCQGSQGQTGEIRRCGDCPRVYRRPGCG